MSGEQITFERLVESIRSVHEQLTSQATRAVNVSLTLRNRLIGCYVSEYELHGADRAEYGEELVASLAERLSSLGVPNCNRRQVYEHLRFYRTYPQIVRSVSAQSQHLLPEWVAGNGEIVPTASAQFGVPAGKLVSQLSYSHFRHLLELDDDLKRTFYEIECIKGGWSVRELRRQIASLYYERSGLSEDKKRLSELANAAAETAGLHLAIRDPYVFEFLGLKPKEVLPESEIEDALLDRLQDFLLELGRGFCFEARQRRILIGDELFFVDLVFYHRVLKCHVLIELKADEFRHEHLGQLNTYVSWYRANEMQDGDNPPVGILLCTRKNHALVQYALAGMANQLFVSKYQLELPSPEQMQRFLEEQLREVGE